MSRCRGAPRSVGRFAILRGSERLAGRQLHSVALTHHFLVRSRFPGNRLATEESANNCCSLEVATTTFDLRNLSMRTCNPPPAFGLVAFGCNPARHPSRRCISVGSRVDVAKQTAELWCPGSPPPRGSSIANNRTRLTFRLPLHPDQ